jgi:hypothetical protein
MTYIYGSNSVNISKDLKKLFKMDYFLDIKELRKVSSIIIKVLDKEFPFLSTIKKLYKVYNSCIPIKKDIVFYTPSIKNIKYDTFIYNNGKKVEKSYFIKPENKEDKYRDISFVFNKYPIDSKIDIDKKSKAIFVNSIHCIDAFLALFVKANLYKESIHCISVHDSFGINITNYKRCLEIYSSGIKVIDKFSFKSILGLETIDKIYSFLRASLEFAEETEDFEFLFRILRKHYQKVENYNYTSYSKVEKKLLSNDKALIEIKSKLKNNTELNKEQITEIKKNKKNIYYNIKKLKEERNNIMRFYIKKKTPVYAYSKEL